MEQLLIEIPDAITTSPSSIGVRPANTRNNVDLPQPLRPLMIQIPPLFR